MKENSAKRESVLITALATENVPPLADVLAELASSVTTALCKSALAIATITELVIMLLAFVNATASTKEYHVLRKHVRITVQEMESVLLMVNVSAI